MSAKSGVFVISFQEEEAAAGLEVPPSTAPEEAQAASQVPAASQQVPASQAEGPTEGEIQAGYHGVRQSWHLLKIHRICHKSLSKAYLSLT